jgi:hypothetical protein
MSKAELALTYAATILNDDNVAITVRFYCGEYRIGFMF